MSSEDKHPMKSYNMHNLACTYLKAAKILTGERHPPMLPLASTYAHSLELAFKCFLTLEGLSRNYIRNKISHDLSKALSKSIDLGLNTHPDMEDLVELLSPMHRERTFHYCERGMIDLPDANQCIHIVQQLLDELEPRINEQLTYAFRGEPSI
jgi:hypothetical protein